MSKTPRTDELEGKLHDKIGHGSYEMALPFCRQLETENAELREALEKIAAPIEGTPVGNPWDFYTDLQDLARRTLEKTK